MKKIIVLFSVFLLVGCTNTLSTSLSIDNSVKVVINENGAKSNTTGKGFKYYKPRDFSLLEDNIYNHVLLNDGNKYYLNIDINGYYNKYKADYKVNTNLYYSSGFSNGDTYGFLEIRKGNNDYFYIKMMYNYSYIEVATNEKGLRQAIINSSIILSSIRYNDKVIENLINSGYLGSKETTYEIKKPPKDETNKNILDVIDYDSFDEE